MPLLLAPPPIPWLQADSESDALHCAAATLDPALLLRRATAALGAFPSDQLRWATSERAEVYAVTLLALWMRRRDHEHEVPHGELLEQVAPPLRTLVSGGHYDGVTFRADLEALEQWGNLERRLEPARIRTLADRRLDKLMVRLSEPTVVLLDFLAARAEAAQRPVGEDSPQHLADVLEALRELSEIAARSDDASAPRARYLEAEIDRRLALIASELVGLGDRLLRFSTAPFAAEDLVRVLEWLERYATDYLGALADARSRVARSLGQIDRPELHALLLRADLAASARPLFPGEVLLRGERPPPAERIGTWRQFFARSGVLDRTIVRTGARIREVVHALRRHLDALLRRDVRLDLVGARLREVAALSVDDTGSRDFVRALYASAHLAYDPRSGTPTERASAPRPRRRHENQRPAFVAPPLEDTTAAAGEARLLEHARLLALSRFVDAAVLRGADTREAHEVTLATPADARVFVRATLATRLRSTRARSSLAYEVLGPRTPQSRARVPAGTTHELDVPDHVFQRRGRTP